MRESAYYQARNKAIGVVQKAKYKGLLKKASEYLCVDCGRQALQWEHRDYTKPLEVEPVCQSCNYKRGEAIY